MGVLTMPQLVFSAAIGGGGDTDVLKPSGTTAAGNLVISPRGMRAGSAEASTGGNRPAGRTGPQHRLSS